MVTPYVAMHIMVTSIATRAVRVRVDARTYVVTPCMHGDIDAVLASGRGEKIVTPWSGIRTYR